MFKDMMDEILYFLGEKSGKIIIGLLSTSMIIGVFFLFYNTNYGNNENELQNKDNNFSEDIVYDYNTEREEYLKLFQTNNQLVQLGIKPITDDRKEILLNEEVVFVDVKTGKKQKVIIKNSSSIGNTKNTSIPTNLEIILLDVDTGIETKVIIVSEEEVVKGYREITVIDLIKNAQKTIIIVYADDVVDQFEINNETTPPPATGGDTGGNTTPPPATGGDTGGNTTPPPATGGDTGGNTTPPPATGGDTGGNTTPPPVTGGDTGGNTTPPPATGGDTGGNTTPPPVTGGDTGGNTTPPPATGGDTGGNTTPPPATIDNASNTNNNENSSGESNYYDEEEPDVETGEQELYRKRNIY